MTREEILRDPEVTHYCDAKRGWVHEAFMDGVDYAERKMGSTIKWQTGEPKENGDYLVSLKNGTVESSHACQKIGGGFDFVPGSRNVVAWCKLSDIKPYKEE